MVLIYGPPKSYFWSPQNEIKGPKKKTLPYFYKFPTKFRKFALKHSDEGNEPLFLSIPDKASTLKTALRRCTYYNDPLSPEIMCDLQEQNSKFHMIP